MSRPCKSCLRMLVSFRVSNGRTRSCGCSFPRHAWQNALPYNPLVLSSTCPRQHCHELQASGQGACTNNRVVGGELEEERDCNSARVHTVLDQGAALTIALWCSSVAPFPSGPLCAGSSRAILIKMSAVFSSGVASAESGGVIWA